MEKHLHGNSKIIEKTKGIENDFDLFFFTAGWESRCTEITKYDLGSFNFKSATILSFILNDEKGYLEKYMKTIKSFIEKKTVCNHIEDKLNNMDDLNVIRKRVEKILLDQYEISKRPLNIGFDISSCPRYFYLHILGFCLKHNIAKKLSFFYSEGIYNSDTRNFIHTEGDWTIVEMVDFSNYVDPASQYFYVISAGFEGSQYRSIVAKYEPDELGILVPDPGFKPEYTEKSIKECEILMEQYYIPKTNITKAPAGDAIAAWKALTNPYLNKKDNNIVYLTVGPKPHVLAMGIHGYLSKNIIVTYRVPNKYTRMEVGASDNFWQYDIENMSVI